MAFPSPHLRLSFGGTQASGNEIWTCSHALGTENLPVSPENWLSEIGLLMAEIGDVLSSFISRPDSFVPNNSKLLWAKLALIGTDGKYMAEPVEIQLNSGGAKNLPYSPQDALVITMVSDVWKGAGKYNRFYLPTVGPQGVNEWQLSESEQTSILTSAQTYFDELNDILATAPNYGETKAFVVSDAREGSMAPVQTVKLGRIVDTQRRRRNKLAESYAELPVSQT